MRTRGANATCGDGQPYAPCRFPSFRCSDDPGMKYRIGIDVGGTFTDLVLAAGDRIRLAKHPTTPADQSDGVLGGLARLADAEGLSAEALPPRPPLTGHGPTTPDTTMTAMSGAPL